jgi:hypothetical protein
MFSLRKRAPIESLLTSTGVNPSFSSQEPRRPRFSFFLSSQCQRADHSAVAGINRHRKQCLQNSARKQDLVAGCPADQPALAENRQQWERTRSASSTWPGYTQHLIQCQHPIFVSSATRNSSQPAPIRKPETQNSFFASVACRSPQCLAAPRSAAVIGYIGGMIWPVNP